MSSLIEENNIKIYESKIPILYYNGIYISKEISKEQCENIIK